jgi:hypothetical protein
MEEIAAEGKKNDLITIDYAYQDLVAATDERLHPRWVVPPKG